MGRRYTNPGCNKCRCSGDPLCLVYCRFTNDCIYGWYLLTINGPDGKLIFSGQVFFGRGFAGIISDIIAFYTHQGSGSYRFHFQSLDGTISFPPPANAPPNGYIDYTTDVDVVCQPRGITSIIPIFVPAPYYTFYVTGTVGGCFSPSNYYVGEFEESITVTCDGPGEIERINPDPHLYIFQFRIKVPPAALPATYTVTASCPGFVSDMMHVTFKDCHDQGTCDKPPSVGCSLYLSRIEYPVYVCGCTDPPFNDSEELCHSMPLQGAMATLSGGLSGSCTTDETGFCVITIGNTWDQVTPIVMTLSHPRFPTQTLVYPTGGDPSFGPCFFNGKMTNPVSGYACFCQCGQPTKTTLNCSIGGFTCTLTTITPDFRGLNYSGEYRGILTADIDSFGVIYGHYVGFPDSSYYAVSEPADGGNVCFHVVFDCGVVSTYYYGTALANRGDGVVFPVPPARMPCDPLPTTDPPPTRFEPIGVGDHSPGTTACGPAFLFTAVSKCAPLPGMIVITE